MHKREDDVSLNDYLTSYLKQFKTSFHSQLSLIQCIASDPTNIQQKIQKAKQGIQTLDQQNSPLQKVNSKLNWKTLERFCLRMNQYIEFRIGKTKGIVDQEITNQLQAMCVALHRVFSQISKQKYNEQQHNIQSIFIRISEIESKYLIKILRRLIQILNKTKMYQKVSQLINQFVSIKLKKRSQQAGSKLDDQQSTNAYTSISYTSHSKRIQFSHKISYQQQFYSAKLRPKRSMVQKTQCTASTLSNSPYSSYINNIYGLKTGISSSHLLLRNPEEVDVEKCEIQQVVKSETKLAKSVPYIHYSLIQDVVQLEYHPSQRYNQQNLLNQLMENNKKNHAIIQKYRKKAKKTKARMDGSPSKMESKTMDVDSEMKHKRSNTIQQIYSIKKVAKKQQRTIALPLLKRKSIKL